MKKVNIFLYSMNYLESNPAKKEVTAHGKNVCYLNNKPNNVEYNISINWA